MKRILTFLLALVMLLGILPVSVRAEEAGDYEFFAPTNRGIIEEETAYEPLQTLSAEGESEFAVRDLAEGESYVTMVTSQSMVDMIKDAEGYSATPYWDNTQWTVGYGSCCGYDRYNKPDIYLTEPQAEARLKKDLTRTYEPIVNDYFEDLDKQPTQQQFDGILDFTYNCGGGWMSGCKLSRWIENPTTEMAFVNAIGAWCNDGSGLNYVLANRRIRDALVFLRGEYYRAYGSYYFDSDVKVVDDDDLPHYKLTIYRANGGTFTATGKNYYIAFYKVGTRYGEFPAVSNGGENLQGWKTTHISNDKLKESEYEIIGPISVVKYNLQVRAYWGEGYLDDPVYEELPEQPAKLPFTDVPEGAWFHDAVKYVFEKKMMNGVSDTAFDPAGQMTRGMLVTVLYRMEGSPALAAGERSGFADIGGAYYTDAIDWAYANKIVNGVDDVTFAPNRVVTRQEAVTIFHRYCVSFRGVTGKTAELGGFLDADQVAGFAKEPFAWAVGTGLVEGSAEADGIRLNPEQTLNRAQAAVLLMRCAEEIL